MLVSFFKDRVKKAVLSPAIAQFLFALLVTVGAVSGGAWGGMGIVGALALALAVGFEQRRIPWPERPVLFFLAAFLFCAALSCADALDPATTHYSILKMLTILLPLAFLFNPLVQEAAVQGLPRLLFLFRLLLIGLALLATASAFGIVFLGYNDTDFVTKLNRGFSYLLMLGWPLWAAYLSLDGQGKPVRRWKVIGFLVVFLIALFINHSRAAQTGIVLSLVFFVVARFFPRLVCGALVLLTVLASFWPFGAQWLYANKLPFVLSLPKSWLARIEIWDYMSYRIMEKPFFGIGLGNASKVSVQTPHSSLYLFATAPAAHPHNAVTQLFGEMGLPGLILGLLFALWVLRGAWRLPSFLRPAALAAYGLTFWLTMTAYNFWTDSLWSAMALTAFAFLVLQRGEKELKLL